MNPPKVSNKTETSSSSGSNAGEEGGDVVKYLNGLHDVINHNDDGTIKIKSRSNGKERNVNYASVEEA